MIILKSNAQLSPKEFDDLYERFIRMRDTGLILLPTNVEFVEYFSDDKDNEVAIQTTEPEVNIKPEEFNEWNKVYIRACDIYLNPKNHQVVEEEKKRLTCKQLLAKERPDYVNADCRGGCGGCPTSHGYIYPRDELCRTTAPSDTLCTQCWNQVATKYYKKEKK